MFDKYYARGYAVGESRILSDTIFFRFRKEIFEFNNIDCCHLVLNYGPAHEDDPWLDLGRSIPIADVKQLRKLKRKKRG